jgi:nitrate reductase (NAD(P)H)
MQRNANCAGTVFVCFRAPAFVLISRFRYAYSGGGRRVVRVDVSLDSGEHWQACTLDLSANDKTEIHTDKTYAWCLWSLEVPCGELLYGNEIVVRAFDDAWNTQPSSPLWNKLGMMNNSWYVNVGVCHFCCSMCC